MPNSAGHGQIELTRVRDHTVVTGARANSPLKLLMPKSGNGAAWVFASTYGGGLLEGDAIQLDVIARSNTRGLLSTQASTKIYRSIESGSRAELNVHIEPGAIVANVPDPVVCFAGARFEQLQRFHLSENAAVCILDCITSGRRARGERWDFSRYRSDTEITLDGRCIFRDAILLDPADGSLAAPMRMGLIDCFATLILAGSALKDHARQILEFIAAQPAPSENLWFSASPIAGDGVVVRIAGPQTESVLAWTRQRLQFLAGVIGQDPWARKM